MTTEIQSDLRPVPCLLMRGGTSRGPFFLESDLPADPAARDRVLLAAMGSPDRRQIDGLGGAHPLTSKAGIVRPSTTPGVALGYETVAELNADTELKARLEALRLTVGPLMGLGDVSTKNYPKMCLVAAPRDGGAVATRCFIPHVCHDSIGVLAAVTVGTACVLQGSVTDGLADIAPGLSKTVSVEHPSGEFSVELGLDPNDPQQVTRAALLRTARLIMRGEVMIPETAWKGQ